MSVNNTFKPGTMANSGGEKTAAGQQLTVEFLAADPALVAGVPRVWINTTTGILKFTHNGTTTKTVTAT